MNPQLSKKQLGIFIAFLVFMAASFYLAYYLLLNPLNTKLERKQSDLNMANKELTIIENNLRQSAEQTVLNSMELQKRLPVKRLLDQLMLNIEKAEIVSDASILEIRLNGKREEVEMNLVEAARGVEEEEEGETLEADTSNNGEEVLPNGIRKVSISIYGEAKTYFEMEKFFESLQTMQRVVKIETLNFKGIPEITSVDQQAGKVEFDLVIAAYYYPALEELQAELPPLDAPSGGNKKNPLHSFSNGEEAEQP